MRASCACSITLVAALTIDCGGSGSPPISHPKLDQDYAGNFAGTWEGTATIAAAGQAPQTGSVRQRIDHTGFNRLAIVELCPGVAATAGLDSATEFSIDPLTCSPIPEACGPVTIRYESGTGKLAQGTLIVTLTGSGAGCGRTLGFTFTFIGILPPPVDHGPPSAVLASTSVSATIGVPVTLDASASSDPDAHPLSFAWSVTSRPSGAGPILTGADTAKPVFTASVEGMYLVKVVVTSSDGQTADAIVQISVQRAIASGQSFIELRSDTGDYIGAGRSYAYTKANAQIALSGSGGLLAVSVNGDENWRADFQLPSSLARFQPGTYDGLQRYPFNDPARGGLDWSGEGRGCNMLTGSFTVASATYSAGALTTIDLTFEQHCEGMAPALHGHIFWDTNDSTQPPGPADPPPGLWEAPSGSTPAAGNYVYLQSDSGDWVGAGQTYAYTQSDALLSVTSSGNQLAVRISGDQSWFGDFQGMSTVARLETGYYGDLQRFPFHNPARGGIDWFGEGRGCNTLAGWFVVDAVTYTNGALSAITLRFEQRCEEGSPALHGQIRWDAGDVTTPPGPQPPPAGLWQPAAGATPGAGNYVYLQSDPADYIGAGGTYTYTQADSLLSVSSTTNDLSVRINGDEMWFADFEGMSTLSRLEVGYYGNLQRYPFHNPVRGGLDWSGEGRGCNTLTGWFVVDAVTYTGNALTAIDLRFEQHCEGGSAALHGQIHWDASDTTQPPGPIDPPPADLWKPAAGSTPASGNYVYLQSDAGDYIGQGATYTYTPATATISLSSSGNRISLNVGGWGGDFQGMSSIVTMEPGYYGGLQRFPFHNPARGGLSFSGQGRGCNELTGWFAVDAVSYANGALTAVDLRFEQHCEGGAPALRGQIHWTAGP